MKQGRLSTPAAAILVHTEFLYQSYRYNLSMIGTSNSMGSSEIWDKYHKCCIENG